MSALLPPFKEARPRAEPAFAVLPGANTNFKLLRFLASMECQKPLGRFQNNAWV